MSEIWLLESLGKGLFRFTLNGVHSSEFVLFDIAERVPKDEAGNSTRN